MIPFASELLHGEDVQRKAQFSPKMARTVNGDEKSGPF